MKLSQKKNCVNCWSLDEHGLCRLGVQVWWFGVSEPNVPCYKPKTKKQFQRALKLMEEK